MRSGAVVVTAVGAVLALCACDDVFGLTRHVDASIDTPADSQLGGPDAPADAASDAAIDAMIDAAPGAVCPTNYGPVMGLGSYRYLPIIMDWPTAQATCAADQISGSTRYTHLAIIELDPERGRLNATQPKRAWIGLTDRVQESVYRWITNSGAIIPAMGSPWAFGEPAHITPTDDCVEMGQTADYAESDCGTLLSAWCECDDRPIVVGTF